MLMQHQRGGEVMRSHGNTDMDPERRHHGSRGSTVYMQWSIHIEQSQCAQGRCQNTTVIKMQTQVSRGPRSFSSCQSSSSQPATVFVYDKCAPSVVFSYKRHSYRGGIYFPFAGILSPEMKRECEEKFCENKFTISIYFLLDY